MSASSPAEPAADDLIDELLALACRLAIDAGTTAAARRLDVVATTTKSSSTDLVTAHDKLAEATVVAGLGAARPLDAIVGEEGTDHPGTSGISWYVDPIDGTTNFVYHLTHWATSIAAGDGDGMLVGAVYLPVLDELFAAARGRGATLNGRPITCSDRTDVALALVATGFGYHPDRRRMQAAVVQRIIGSVRDIRRLGAASVDLCYVAAGRYDAYYESGLNAWDAAAGELIAREAGCRSGDFRGGPSRAEQLLVTAPAIFDAMTALLSD